MDWVDGWYETSKSTWQTTLGITQVTINCSNSSARTNAQSCVSWIQQHPSPGISQYVPYIDPSTTLLVQEGTDYSTATNGVSSIPEIDIDDFFSHYADWLDHGLNAATLLDQFITHLKSVNHNLKFGATIYVDELRQSYASDAALPPALKARFDVVRLFIHFRADGPNYARYVAQAQSMFPNAQIVAGLYPYDRIDYIGCPSGDWSKATLCTQAQELDYFQQALNVQVSLLQQGQVQALDIYPGYIGDEGDLFGPGNNSDGLTCSNVSRCVSNTIAMRNMILAARQGYVNPGQRPDPPLVAADFSALRVYPNPWRSNKHSGIPVTFNGLTENSAVKIFTVSGHLVKTLPMSSASATWDLTNDSGERVASGLYIYSITSDQGQKKTGQLAVIQ